ncbi:MAG: amidohydrolase [Opitutae bacterium]|nr:amidohydrolase [Opitutae bacterium]
MKVDSHHHFWNYDPVEYSWMNEDMGVLKRDFGPSDLREEIEAAGIDGVVSVQASQTLAETDALLEHAKTEEFILGVVGWFPFAEANVAEIIEPYANNALLKGARHVVQDEPDDRFILGEAFNRGISCLKEFGLVYDILIYERQLAPSIEFVDKHPDLVFVLDHVAKPRIGDNAMEPWAALMKQMAERPNVSCKLSGMATEGNWENWTEEQLVSYMEVALDAFGPNRMMFGSDWPVALLAIDYQRWVGIVQEFISTLSADEQAAIEGGTACRVYGL